MLQSLCRLKVFAGSFIPSGLRVWLCTSYKLTMHCKNKKVANWVISVASSLPSNVHTINRYTGFKFRQHTS